MLTKNRVHIVKAVSELTLEHIDKKIPYMNWGGCGLVAEHLYDLFNDIGVKDIEIILLVKGCYVEDMINWLIKIMKIRKAGSSVSIAQYKLIPAFSHIILKVDGIYIDSEGTYKSKLEMPDFSTRTEVSGMDYELLHGLNRIPELWNPKFERERFGKTVKTNFNIIKKNIKKDLVMSE